MSKVQRIARFVLLGGLGAGLIAAGTGRDATAQDVDQAYILAKSAQAAGQTGSAEAAFAAGILEGVRRQTGLSDFYVLNHLELDYTLAKHGVNTISVLGVQPLFQTADLRNSLFLQGGWGHSSEGRNTINTGLGYRHSLPGNQHMFGVSAGFDHETSFDHNRLSLGVDYMTSLIGIGINKYWGVSGWHGDGGSSGLEEKASSGMDLRLQGRLPQFAQLGFFATGYHWQQDRTAGLNTDGDDIWGYEFSTEYTPINLVTFRAAAGHENSDQREVQGSLTMRINLDLAGGFDKAFEAPVYNLSDVRERRFEKIRRENTVYAQSRYAGNVVPGGGGGADCPNIGDVCLDGTLYGGTTIGGARLMVAAADEGQVFWATVNNDTAADDDNDGLANTAALLAPVGQYPAAQACDASGAHGYNDWYLPARNELNDLIGNLGPANGNPANLQDDFYWSSTEIAINLGWANWSNFQAGAGKGTARWVRCVRRA